MLRLGRINPRARLTVVRESASTATVDGDNGLGLVVGPKANRIAMGKADDAGSGWVSVRNTNHFGIAGYYVMEALERDLIGIAMTNSTKLVAPLWGGEGMLGTNPIATAFPGLHEPPIVIDMATSAVSLGKVEIAARAGEPIPGGWAIDARGEPADMPEQMIDGGALLPLGSDREHGGHKGYCLAVLVDVLSCVFSGANWGPFAPSFAIQYAAADRRVGKGIGHFFGAWRIDAFIDPGEFKRQIDDYIRTLRATRPAPGTSGPLIPGDPERASEEERVKSGIPLVMPVVEDLRHISRETGIPFD
jgi:LDH2 family malate/lactate/ureidoglycolate dehydrogenase